MKSFLLGFMLVFASAARGLEIPVRRGGAGGATVGYVDMELVFREYPEAKKAREEYRQELLRQKTELAARERALEDLKGEIDVLKGKAALAAAVDRSTDTSSPGGLAAGASSAASPLPGAVPAVSTGTPAPADPSTLKGESAGQASGTAAPVISTAAAASQAEIGKREDLLLKRQKELEEARDSSAKSLREFEASRSKTILGRLYKALVELAEERGISIVVDKSAILYGQNTVDLTDALNRRVRGLPTETR